MSEKKEEIGETTIPASTETPPASDEKPWKKHETAIWTPQKGTILVGIYYGNEQIGTKNSRLHQIKAENGEKIKVWGTKILDDHLCDIEVGKAVKLEYLGLIRREKENDYHDWSVFIRD